MISSVLDIIIPMYNASDELIACIDSILSSDAAQCKILLLNDASYTTEEEKIKKHIDCFHNIELISNRSNNGYTKNISNGLMKVQNEFVCIINSDTIVPNIWAGKLLKHLMHMPVLAGVGPLSNAASFQSIPYVYNPNGLFSVNQLLGGNDDELECINWFLDFFSKDAIVDIPILNGFCTIFRKEALEEIGGFDFINFPTGYGEENDVCIKLKKFGYRLSVALDCFVHHKKSRSFGDQNRIKFSQKGSETLKKIYGADFMGSINSLLKHQPQLELVRLATELLFSFKDNQGNGYLYNERVLYFSKNQDGLYFCEEDSKITGITIVGPVSCAISDTQVIKLDSIDVSSFTFGYDPVLGFIVHIPAEKELRLFSRQPVLSALLSLAFESYVNVVYLTGWEHIPGLEKDCISRIKFDKLYPTPASNSITPQKPVIGVSCSLDENQIFATGSAFIRVWERIVNAPERPYSFIKMTPRALLRHVSNGAINYAILQRTTLPQVIWEQLKNYIIKGQFHYLYELDDYLVDTGSEIDIKNEYESTKIMVSEMIQYASIVTVSTKQLYKKIKPINSKVVIVPNALSNRLWGGNILKKRESGIFRCLYMGTRTHEEDLALIFPALENIAGEYSNFRLSIIGVVRPQLIPFFPDWVEVYKDFNSNYPEFVAWLKSQAYNFDCGLAPLVENEFTSCESSLKILDYAGLALPVIASAGIVYSELGKKAPAVKLVDNNPEAWKDAILSYMSDVSLLEKGLQMREWVLRHYMIDSEEYDILLRDHLVGS